MDSSTATIIVGMAGTFGTISLGLTIGLLNVRGENRRLAQQGVISAAQIEANKSAIAQKDIEIAAKKETDENTAIAQFQERILKDNQGMHDLIVANSKTIEAQGQKIGEQDKHIVTLEQKIDILIIESRTNRAGWDKSEADNAILRGKLDAAEIKVTKVEGVRDALREELKEQQIMLDAALRGADAYAIASRERERVREEQKTEREAQNGE